MTVFRGGHATYGHAIGILMLDARFARVPGDIGNATTYPFPVLYHIIEGVLPRRVVDGDPSLLELFVEGARDLEKCGVIFITTGCGFLATFQKQLASAVRVPVFTSSLLQVPLVSNMLGAGRRVGILTADASCLTEAHFRGAGWSSADIRIAVQGMEDYPCFTETILGSREDLDFEAVGAEVTAAAQRLVADCPDVGAIVFECTNLPPYSKLVQDATGLPVFDINTLIDMAYRACTQPLYQGQM